MGANEPRSMANLDTRDMVRRIYVGDHLIMLHINYLSSLVSEKKIFEVFPTISLWELMSPRAWLIWTLGTWLAGFM